jgi:hypothetical protein
MAASFIAGSNAALISAYPNRGILVLFKVSVNCLSFYHKVKNSVIPISIMPAECLIASIGVLAGTLGLLGFLWYSERRTRKDMDRNSVSKKRDKKELLNEHTLTN